MPSYDFRCNQCGRAFSRFFKSIHDYQPEAAQPCPHCQSTATSRRIRGVAIPRPGRDYSQLSSDEMLSVLNGGQEAEMERMFNQVAESAGVDPGEVAQQASQALSD